MNWRTLKIDDVRRTSEAVGLDIEKAMHLNKIFQIEEFYR